MSRISHLDYSDSDSLNSEEEEQEQLLSRSFGEAEEEISKKRKKGDQSGGGGAEDEAKDLLKKKRKPRPKLTEEMLMGPNGLLKLQRDFARAPDLKCKRRGDEARYIGALVHKLSDFCFGLFPHMAFENVLERVETLGQSNKVKKYLTEMRNDVRNDHLVSVFGRERAEAMIAELEGHIMTTSTTAQFTATDGGTSASAVSLSPSPTTVVNPYGRNIASSSMTQLKQTNMHEDANSEQEENEAVFEEHEEEDPSPSLSSSFTGKSASSVAHEELGDHLHGHGHQAANGTSEMNDVVSTKEEDETEANIFDNDDDDDEDDAATKAYSEVAGDSSDDDDESTTSLQVEMPATEEESASEQLVLDDSQAKRVVGESSSSLEHSDGRSVPNDNSEKSVFDDETTKAHNETHKDEHEAVEIATDQVSACTEVKENAPTQSMDY